MKISQWIGLLALPLVVGGTNIAAAPSAASEPTAQELLFDATYLAPVAAPSRIKYHFSFKSVDSTLFGASYDDDASMQLKPTAGAEGYKDVTLDMFTGERLRELGPLPKINGNPIIMMFLEYDTNLMQKHVGGAMVYYRNIVRAAFRDKATVQAVDITWNGKPVKAMKISIQPFQDIPAAEKLQLFRGKIYEFTVSDAVPGGIYDMRSVVPDLEGKSPAPAMDTHLTLTGIDYETPKN
jgi:hypothetical protein